MRLLEVVDCIENTINNIIIVWQLVGNYTKKQLVQINPTTNSADSFCGI